MKHFKRLISIAIVAVLMLCLASCDYFENQKVDITNDNIKIGVLLPGSGEDTTGVTAYCLNAINELTGLGYGISGDRFKYAENISTADADAVSSSLNSLINFECNLIIASDPGYEDAVKPVADKNENVTFIVFNGEQYGKNVFSYNANITGASYLSGIAAGLKAAELKVPVLGFLAANEKDLTTVNAFAEGAKSVNPKVQVKVMVGTDAAANSAKLINEGCVVLASDFESEDIAKAADDGKIYFCGFGTDVYSSYENSFLCAPMYTFTQCYIDYIKAVVDNNDGEDSEPAVELTNYNGGYSTGATALSDLNDNTVAPTTKEAVTAASANLMNGALTIELSALIPVAGVTIVK